MIRPIYGIFPVMITPFTEQNKIDWEGYEALIEWYLNKGAQGLFAVCQSSEMQLLSLDERRELAQFTVQKVAGRVPVVASGHISDAPHEQKQELQTVAGTGIDALVFVTNRLAKSTEDSPSFLVRLQDLMADLPADLPLGLYECPAPYRRLLTDEELLWCANSGRFAFLKDVSCDLETVKRRLGLSQGTPLVINNANAAIAWPVMQAGGKGFSGVMNNFHPDLYRWLFDHGHGHAELAAELDRFLVLAAMCESMGYPKLAKEYHRRLGTFRHTHSRVVSGELSERFWAVGVILEHIMQGAEHFRQRIALLRDAV